MATEYIITNAALSSTFKVVINSAGDTPDLWKISKRATVKKVSLHHPAGVMWAGMGSPLARLHPAVVATIDHLQTFLAGGMLPLGVSIESMGEVVAVNRSAERLAGGFRMLSWGKAGDDHMAAEIAGHIPYTGRQVRYLVVVPVAGFRDRNTWAVYNHRRVANGFKWVKAGGRQGLASKLFAAMDEAFSQLNSEHRDAAVSAMRTAKAQLDAAYAAQQHDDGINRPWAVTRNRQPAPQPVEAPQPVVEPVRPVPAEQVTPSPAESGTPNLAAILPFLRKN